MNYSWFSSVFSGELNRNEFRYKENNHISFFRRPTTHENLKPLNFTWLFKIKLGHQVLVKVSISWKFSKVTTISSTLFLKNSESPVSFLLPLFFARLYLLLLVYTVYIFHWIPGKFGVVPHIRDISSSLMDSNTAFKGQRIMIESTFFWPN